MGDSSNSPLSLSLRPWPAQSKQAESSAELQARLFMQRGHFRHITEAGLDEEIARAELGDLKDGDDSDSQDGEHELSEKERREKLLVQKQSMLQYLQQANNEAMIARDFISLLISKDSPNTAQISLSPAAKEAVPIGSLGWTKWHSSASTEPTSEKKEEAARDVLLAQGVRMEALSNTADTLLSAATRLESDVRRETKYWEQVLSITEKGWSVRKIQNDRFNLGVQLGFAEAGEQFKRRGFIPLSTDDDGSVILDQELTKTPHTLRVSIVHKRDIIGVSRLPQHVRADDAELEHLIARARDSLFDEELFHEISLETRELVAYDVTMKNSTIRVPWVSSNETLDIKPEIHIDLIELNESSPQSQASAFDDVAQNIAISLRLLLSRIHQQRLQRRSEVPPPLSGRKELNPPEAILRPLMGFFLHRRDTEAVRKSLDNTSKTLREAGLNIQLKFHTGESIATIAKDLATATSHSPIAALVTPFVQPLKSTAKISLPSTLPSASSDLLITITTKLSAPSFGTQFTLVLPSSPLSFSGILPASRTLVISEGSELCAYIRNLLAMDIAHNILGAQILPKWTRGEREPHVIGCIGGDGRITIAPDKACKIRVHVESETLVVTKAMLKSKDNEPGRYYKWSAKTGGVGDIRGLVRTMAGLAGNAGNDVKLENQEELY